MDITLYRRRIIPQECVKLKDDIILHMDKKILVTEWKTLKPRKDFHHGYSLYLFEEGIKVSKFLREDDSLLYWYCDIVEYDLNETKDELTVTDLLADITVDGEGHLNVLDVDELSEAYDKGLITDEMFHTAVRRLGNLINAYQTGEFKRYTDIIDGYAGQKDNTE